MPPLAATSPWAIAVPASVTVAVAILTAWSAYLAGKRDRRRTLYAEAVKAAVVWKEMLYRIRRRGPGEERALIARLHDAQDNITFHEAWIASESRFLARSYGRFVTAVKHRAEPLITGAWAEPLRPAPGNALPEDVHPSIEEHLEAFMGDLRAHLSVQPWRKCAVAYRNRRASDGG